jgi:hypothetical protein
MKPLSFSEARQFPCSGPFSFLLDGGCGDGRYTALVPSCQIYDERLLSPASLVEANEYGRLSLVTYL